jgi:uncharacterized protein YrrD
MKTAIIMLAVSGGFWSDTAPRRTVRAERLVTPSGMPDVFVVYDTQNKTMCHITHSSEGGGGIFCQPLPQGLEK